MPEPDLIDEEPEPKPDPSDWTNRFLPQEPDLAPSQEPQRFKVPSLDAEIDLADAAAAREALGRLDERHGALAATNEVLQAEIARLREEQAYARTQFQKRESPPPQRETPPVPPPDPEAVADAMAALLDTTPGANGEPRSIERSDIRKVLKMQADLFTAQARSDTQRLLKTFADNLAPYLEKTNQSAQAMDGVRARELAENDLAYIQDIAEIHEIDVDPKTAVSVYRAEMAKVDFEKLRWKPLDLYRWENEVLKKAAGGSVKPKRAIGIPLFGADRKLAPRPAKRISRSGITAGTGMNPLHTDLDFSPPYWSRVRPNRQAASIFITPCRHKRISPI